MYCTCRRYGCLNLLLDVLLTVVTHGFWLIWIFIREMRYSNRVCCGVHR